MPLRMMFPDGGIVKGKKENMEAPKKYRDGITKVVSTVHGWFPISSVDRGSKHNAGWQQVNPGPSRSMVI